MSKFYDDDKKPIQGIAMMLGIPMYRVKTWVKRHGLPIERPTCSHSVIRVSDVQKLARDNPKLFGGIDQQDLERFLKDKDLAIQCASYDKPRSNKNKPVKCVETGVEYENVYDAADAYDIYDPCQINTAIYRKCRAGGVHWTRDFLKEGGDV